MKLKLITLLTMLCIVAKAQYVIKPTTINCDKISLKIKDDTLYIPSGTRGSLILRNFENVVVIAKGAYIKANTGYGIWMTGCKNVKLIGVDKGLVIDGGNNGLSINYSTRIEVGFIEVKNTKFAGIMCKTEPTCDPLTWRSNLSLHMSNMRFHDNYIHKTGGEAYYIGYTFYSGKKISASCDTVYAHTLDSVFVYNNIIDSTGADGIQVGSADGGAYIYNNKVTNTGLDPFADHQSNGIQVGDGTAGNVYNNVISNVPGSGIILLGKGNNVIHNNLIANSQDIGIFTDERSGTIFNTDYLISSNTIINCKNYGILLYSESMNNYLINNVIYGNNQNIAKSKGVKTYEVNNKFRLDSLQFEGYYEEK